MSASSQSPAAREAVKSHSAFRGRARGGASGRARGGPVRYSQLPWVPLSQMVLWLPCPTVGPHLLMASFC